MAAVSNFARAPTPRNYTYICAILAINAVDVVRFSARGLQGLENPSRFTFLSVGGLQRI
jgi:hypothetical protein